MKRTALVKLDSGAVPVRRLSNVCIEGLEARRLLASVSGYTQDDINTNGIDDTGDWPAPGRTVYADLDQDGVLDDGEPRTVSQSPSGFYQLTGIPAGTTYLRQVLPTNWVQAYPANNAPRVVTLREGLTMLNQNFGSRNTKAHAIISVGAFEDMDANGQWQSEPRNPLRTIYIDSDDDGVPDSGEPFVVTASDGLAEFRVDAGTYKIRQVVPPGWAPTKPFGNGAISITISSIYNRTFVQWFGTRRIEGGVRGLLFNDANGNGLNDARDGLALGRTVYVDLDDDGEMDDAEPRGISGLDGYVIDGVPAGYHAVRVLADADARTTWPASGAAYVQVFRGLSTEAPDIGHFEAPTISGLVYHDVNGNGRRDVGEPGVAGAVAHVDVNRNRFEDNGEPRTITDSSGAFEFRGLNVGQPRVSVEAGDGVTMTRVDADYVDLLESGWHRMLWFGLRSGPILTGTLFRDENADGVMSGEQGMPGRGVFADLDNDGSLDPGEPVTTTDTTGYFSLLVPAGTTVVRPVVPQGYVVSGADGRSGTVADLESVNVGTLGLRADDRAQANVSGWVYEDLDRNGRYGPRDVPIAGRAVFADLNNNMRFDDGEPWEISDASGMYVLTELDARDTRVLQRLPEGWVQTQPVTGGLGFHDFALGSTSNYVEANFGSFGPGGPVLSAAFDAAAMPHALRVAADRALGGGAPVVEDFVVERVADGTRVAVALGHDADAHVTTLTFPEAPRGLLPPGRYRLTVAAGAVRDAFGTPAAAQTFEFRFLPGDVNGDDVVNADDYFRLDSGFLAQPQNPTYFDGDFNHDDRINADDYFLIDSAFLSQVASVSSWSPSSSVAADTADREGPRKRGSRVRTSAWDDDGRVGQGR